MLVYTITQTEYGTGYTTPLISNLIVEFEVEIKTNGASNEFCLDNIPKVAKSIETLRPVKEGDAGAMVVFGPFLISVGEMSEEKYGQLPEFDGW